MKKIVLMVAVVACVAFASQSAQAVTVQASVENVMQDDFVKIEVKIFPRLYRMQLPSLMKAVQ